MSAGGGCISFSLLSCGLLRLGLRVRRASLGDSAALRPSPSRVGSVALARSCSRLVLCPTSGATVQLLTEGPLEWLVGVGPAMGSTAHGSRCRRCSGALGSLGARQLAPARRVRTRSTRSRSSTLVLIVHLGQLSPLAAPAGGLGILGPPLDGGSDEPPAARCAGVCRLRGSSALQHSARSLKGPHTHTHTRERCEG